ncbi:MAG: hypothetical protein ACK5P5_06045 [Pseudobdellovibrionaceae bacterium]
MLHLLNCYLKKSMIICFGVISLLCTTQAWAYPSFIGYGYKTCMTCHYNGHGSGALNDYGRSLWAVEIAARSLFDKKTTDEELGQKSGFLGKTEIPWGLRPGIKYRGLYYATNPGSQSSRKDYIWMQGDVSLAIQFDQDQKYIFVASGGYLPPKQGSDGTEENKNRILSRELYFRMNFQESYFLYAGLMDKIYGIRIVDHTSYSRSRTGNAQNDQTAGAALQFIGENKEISGHVFTGNTQQKAELRHKGFSGMFEYDVSEDSRVGTSILSSNNDFINWLRAALHAKRKFGKGNALIGEFGIIQNKPKSTGESENGNYGMAEATLNLTRGYNFISQVEYYNKTGSTKTADETRWSLGFLIFPMAKTEFRFNFVNGRNITDTGVTPDSWSAQTQLHLSL